MKNKIGDLRDHLFEVIEMLKDGDMEIDRAHAIKDVAQIIINSAKVEVAYLKQVGATSNEFIPVEENNRKQLGQ